MIGWRKIIILVICLTALMFAAIYMDADDYANFVNGVIWIGGAALGANAITNATQNIRKGKTPDGKPYD
jgi:hypothetical protein